MVISVQNQMLPIPGMCSLTIKVPDKKAGPGGSARSGYAAGSERNRRKRIIRNVIRGSKESDGHSQCLLFQTVLV